MRINIQQNNFRNEGEIKTLPGKQRLREFIVTRPVLKVMLMGVLHVKTKLNSNSKSMKKPIFSVKVNTGAIININILKAIF